MKKIAVISLLFLHLFAGVGVFASLHYCGKNLMHLSFFSDAAQYEEQKNCTCETFAKDNCCDDVVIKSTLRTESTVVASFHLQKVFAPISAVIFSSSIPYLTQSFLAETFIHNKWRGTTDPTLSINIQPIVLRF